jgi:hypothetical protein
LTEILGQPCEFQVPAPEDDGRASNAGTPVSPAEQASAQVDSLRKRPYAKFSIVPQARRIENPQTEFFGLAAAKPQKLGRGVFDPPA